jgi:hypothetical protein
VEWEVLRGVGVMKGEVWSCMMRMRKKWIKERVLVGNDVVGIFGPDPAKKLQPSR